MLWSVPGTKNNTQRKGAKDPKAAKKDRMKFEKRHELRIFEGPPIVLDLRLLTFLHFSTLNSFAPFLLSFAHFASTLL